MSPAGGLQPSVKFPLTDALPLLSAINHSIVLNFATKGRLALRHTGYMDVRLLRRMYCKHFAIGLDKCSVAYLRA